MTFSPHKNKLNTMTQIQPILITSQASPARNLPTPLYTTSAIRQIEAQAISARQSHETTLMQRAGYALYSLAQACYPHAHNILIVAGKGNNGGDAIVAATHLKQKGKQVYLIWLGDTKQASIDTQEAIQIAQKHQITLHPYTPETINNICKQGVDLIIDGLLGIGLDASKPLSDNYVQLITLMNQLQAPVIAVDVPSGLIAQTGAIHTQAVHASHTLSFLAAKPGLFTAQGREYCGQIWLDTLDIQLPTLLPCSHLYAPSSCASPRAHNTHKGSFGDVSIIGGAPGMVGAALLAARAALKAGAGRAFISLLENEHNTIPFALDFSCPELMFKPVSQLSFKQSSIVCGCGGGLQVKNWLPQLLHECPRLVLDADALNAIAASKTLQQQLQARKALGFATILTPHPLEAARLLQTTSENIQNNRMHFAALLADTFECTCVLKGSGSITTTPGQLPFINSSGNAALATAGSGDVLAGWLGGRWSAANHTLLSLHQLAAQCTWEHGHAADQWLQQGHQGVLPASKLISQLP